MLENSLDRDIAVNTHMTEMNLNNDVTDNNQTMLDSQFPTQSNLKFAESRNHIAKQSNDGSTGG